MHRVAEVPAGMMIGRPGRAGMMIVRAGLTTVTGRRDPAAMMTAPPGPDVMTTGRPDRAGTMIVRAGLMTVTGRRDPAVMMTARPGRAGTMRRDRKSVV